MTRHTPDPRPPRGARLLLRLLPADIRDLVLQDLSEEYAARVGSDGPGPAGRRYWSLALRSIVDAYWQRRHAVAPGHLFSDLLLDARQGMRSLRRTPSFSLSVIATLSIAFGGAATISGLVHSVFWAPLPLEHGDRLVRLLDFSYGPQGDRQTYNMTSRDFLAIREESSTFQGVAAQNGFALSVRTQEGFQSVQGIQVSEGWGEVLGIEPFLGRLFTPDEEALGAEAGVAVISHGLWQDFLGGGDVLGRTIAHTGGALVVVGVLPPGFSYPDDAHVWVPHRFQASDWRNHDLNVVGVMRPGVGMPQVRAELQRIWAGLVETAPGTLRAEGLEARMARDDLISNRGAVLKALAGVVFFLLLLACSNIASLFAVRFVARAHESALRAALGAGRMRLLRAAVTESQILFVLGALGGLAVARFLGGAASALIPTALRDQLDAAVRIQAPVVAFVLGLALLTGLLTGVTAAYRATRVDLRSALVGSRRQSPSAASSRLLGGLVVAELALALSLLLGASVMTRHFQRLSEADLGFSTAGLYSVQLTLQQERYRSVDARGSLIRDLEDAIGRVSGIEEVGLTSVNPLCCGDWGAMVRVEGMEPAPDDPPIVVHHRYVTTGYFRALGLTPVRGRLFQPGDTPDAPAVVIIDEAAAARFWPGENPIGKRLARPDPDAPWIEVVGVVPTTYQEGVYTQTWYLPFLQNPTGRSTDNFHFMVRTRSADALPEVRRAITTVDPTLAIQRVAPMATLRRERIASDRTGAVVAGLFGTVGVLLAALGLYGLLTYQVNLRRLEIGTQLALGALPRDVMASVVGRTARLLALGTVLGTAFAYGLNLFLTRTVEGVRIAGPGEVVTLLLLLSGVALAATAAPALRAAASDPAQVLRNE